MFRLTGKQRYQIKNLKRYWFVLKNNLLEGEFHKLWHMFSRRIYAKIKGYPTGIYLEINSTCNLNCVFCWSRMNMDRPAGLMKKEDAFKILDDVSPYVSWMCPFSQGEPLLHPDLFEILSYANKKGLMTEISTNAMLLTEDKSKKLIEVGLDNIVLSFDGASKESYEKNRRGAVFETVVNNIKTLSRLKKELRSGKPHMLIQMVVTKNNKHEIKDFVALAKDMGANEIFLRNLSLANTSVEEERQAVKDLLPDGTYNIQNGRLVENPNKLCDKRVPVICSNGKVALCCYDFNCQYCFGDAIKQHLIKDIWLNEGFKQFRKGPMKHMKLDICKQCRTSYHEIPDVEH